MNTEETMRALLDGKRITANYLKRDGEFLWLSAGELVDQTGLLRNLSSRQTYEVYYEPNPHTVGTFAWAREEHKRGRTVGVSAPELGYSFREYGPDSGDFDSDGSWYTWEIDAKNWQVVL